MIGSRREDQEARTADLDSSATNNKSTQATVGKSSVWKQLFASLAHGSSALRIAFRNLSTKDTIPYCASFPVRSGFSLPTKFSLSTYPGLLFCYLTRTAADEKLVTYWIDEEHFRAYSSAIQLLCSSESPILTGAVVDVRSHRTLSLRSKILAIAAAIAASFGALSAIRDYYGELFSSPDVAITYSEPGVLNSIESGSIPVSLNVTNEVRYSSKIEWSEAVMRPSSPQTGATLRVDPDILRAATIPNLAPGASTTIKIYITAPQLPESQRLPKTYILSIKARAKAGVWWFSKVVPAADKELRVWPETLGKPVTTEVSVNSTHSCRFGITLYLAKSSMGLHAEITAIGTPKQLRYIWVQPMQPEQSKPITSPDLRVMKFKFTTPPLEQFKEYNCKIYLELLQPSSEAVCSELSKSLDVSFEE